MQLVSVYARVVSDADAEQDNDMLFDQGFHILQPIIRLLEACSNIPKLMSDLEEMLLPVLQDICNRCPEDLFEQVHSEIISQCNVSVQRGWECDLAKIRCFAVASAQCSNPHDVKAHLCRSVRSWGFLHTFQIPLVSGCGRSGLFLKMPS